MLLQALHVEIEMKNLNLQVTLLVQKRVGTRSHTFPPHYTPGYKRISQSELLHFRQEDISQNLAETSLSPWLWEFDCYAKNCCWGRIDLQIT